MPEIVLPTINLKVSLLKDRNKLGTAALYNKDTALAGPFYCLGKADSAAGAAHGNPTLDPLKPYGNTPTGIYRGQVVMEGNDLRSFGTYKRILLTPYSGQCVTCEELRAGLMVHGGALNVVYTWWQGLRPTHGCIRLADTSMKAILDAIPTFNISNLLATITEIEG